jgi:hypothetical protein
MSVNVDKLIILALTAAYPNVLPEEMKASVLQLVDTVSS